MLTMLRAGDVTAGMGQASNVTACELTAKRLGLLRNLMPASTCVACSSARRIPPFKTSDSDRNACQQFRSGFSIARPGSNLPLAIAK
jgi:hypothetical protein